jgi:hypothetical protein
MLLLRHQNIGQNRDITTAKRLFENVSQFKYLGTTVTNQYLIQEAIKRRLNSDIACYHSIQNLLSSHLMSKNVNIKIYKTIILLVVMYGCETWSLTVREEHRLQVFENRVLTRIFGLKRDEVTGKWRRLHNEELCDLYSSPSIIRIIKLRRMRWAGHVARMGENKNVYMLLVGKPEGKRPLGRPRHRWVDINTDLGEVGCGDVDWIGLAQDRNRWRALVNLVLNLLVPYNAGKLWSGLTTGGLSSSSQLHRVGYSVSVYKKQNPYTISNITRTSVKN